MFAHNSLSPSTRTSIVCAIITQAALYGELQRHAEALPQATIAPRLWRWNQAATVQEPRFCNEVSTLKNRLKGQSPDP
jgi:hypothetical protein